MARPEAAVGAKAAFFRKEVATDPDTLVVSGYPEHRRTTEHPIALFDPRRVRV